MNRERVKELLPIFEAYANGEDIQFRPNQYIPESGPITWSDLTKDERLTITFPCDDYEYRIKPKPLEVFMHINRKTGKVVGWNHKSETMHQDPKIIHKLFREVLE